MSDFVDIFAEVLRIATFQPREAQMRYRLQDCEARMQAPERQTRRDDATPVDPNPIDGKAPASSPT